jgi:hypothetical protein
LDFSWLSHPPILVELGCTTIICASLLYLSGLAYSLVVKLL